MTLVKQIASLQDFFLIQVLNIYFLKYVLLSFTLEHEMMLEDNIQKCLIFIYHYYLFLFIHI